MLFFLLALMGMECTGGVTVTADTGDGINAITLAAGQNEQTCRSFCQTPRAVAQGDTLEDANAQLFAAVTTMGLTCACYSFTPSVPPVCRLSLSSLTDVCTSIVLGEATAGDSNMAVFDCREYLSNR